MKSILTLIFITSSYFSFAQISSVVLNSENNTPISHVNIWIENEKKGTTTDNEGAFNLEIDSTKIVLISAIGFEPKRIISDSIKNTISLKPLITELDEVLLTPRKRSKEIIIDELKRKRSNNSYGCSFFPWMVGKYFEYKQSYKATPYLNTLKFITKNEIDNAKFNVRLYSTDSTGVPKKLIHNVNIFGYAKKGRTLTEVDVSDLNIKIPENGLFVAVEWLLIDKNKHTYTYSFEGSNKEFSGIKYQPSFGMVFDKHNSNGWFYTGGKWRRERKNSNSVIKKSRNAYKSVGIQLSLMD